MNATLPYFQSLAHAIAPAGSTTFDAMACLSLAGYLVFAVVALNYALRPWAEKMMFAAIGAATMASLLLHLSLLSTPAYTGEGPLWKFVAISRYLPWAVIGLTSVYVLYRAATAWRKARSACHQQ